LATLGRDIRHLELKGLAPNSRKTPPLSFIPLSPAVKEQSRNIAVHCGRNVAVGGCGSIPVYGGSTPQFNGPMLADAGYRGGQFGYQPHVGAYPQPPAPPPPDARDGSLYAMGPANQFASADGSGSGQQFADTRQTVPGSFQYPGPHPSPLQTGTSQNNLSNSSTSSKAPTSVPPELPETGSQSKSKQEDRNLPPKSSGQMPTPDGRLQQSTDSSGTSHSSVASNGSTEQLPKRDSLSEVEQQSGDVTVSSSGNVAGVDSSARTSVPSSIPSYPSNAHQAPNMDGVHGRSSDVVAMEGMPSRYGVGPEDMMDVRYPANGRDGYIGRMGHPVAVDTTFRHGYPRQMESYDRPLYGAQAGMPPHFQHPGYFSHPNQPGYQYHPHSHSNHGPSSYSQVHVINTYIIIQFQFRYGAGQI